jgi:hypothetical protein
MSETEEDKSPFGPGFVAACIVVGAILLCGVVLLVTSPSSGSTSAAASTPGSVAASAGATAPAAGNPASPGNPAPPGSPASLGRPATPDASATTGQPAAAASSGSLADGDQAIPAKAPPADGWEVSRRVVVPRSSTYGPARTDPDGFRHCFAHSPTGALYAAYNAIAAVADERQAIPTVRKLMLPGAATDALIRELGHDDTSGESATTQLAGYRLIDAGPDRATVMLAIPVESAYMSATLTLVWHDGDWRVQPPPPGEPVGAPFAQHRDLSDFVSWSGV